MHGGTKRMRERRQTGSKHGTVIKVDKDKILSTVVTSAVGGVVSAYVTKELLGNE